MRKSNMYKRYRFPGEIIEYQFTADHATEGLINLFSMESPSFTASLAIADYVTEKI